MLRDLLPGPDPPLRDLPPQRYDLLAVIGTKLGLKVPFAGRG